MKKSRASIRGKLHQRKRVQLTCLISVIENKPHAHHAQGSFAYKERRHDFYPQFARSPLGTPESMPPFSRRIDENQRLAFRTNAGINQRDARSYSLF